MQDDESKPHILPPYDVELPNSLYAIYQCAHEIATQRNRSPRIVVMMGAGASVSAGIPDFRSPGIGLYSNLQKYNVPTAESIFTLSYFRENPQPFCLLVRDLYPTGKYKPTPAHHFIAFLARLGWLQRCYTQNIDGLEEIAGVPADLVIQSHGGFGSASCIDCHAQADTDMVRQILDSCGIPRCLQCHGLVKPDIVLFGEDLPQRWNHLTDNDFALADILIVMGSSLQVFPFCYLWDKVGTDTPRLIINREKLAGQEIGRPDYFFQGDCDDACSLLRRSWQHFLRSPLQSPLKCVIKPRVMGVTTRSQKVKRINLCE